MTLTLPLASRQRIFTVCKAHAKTMPETESVRRWKIETEYLAVSEDQMETGTIRPGQLDKSILSNKYRKCHENMATEIEHSSCVTNLFVKGLLDALKVCDTEKMLLPIR